MIRKLYPLVFSNESKLNLNDEKILSSGFKITSGNCFCRNKRSVNSSLINNSSVNKLLLSFKVVAL